MKKRLFNLDLIRAVALLCIIFNHALNTVWNATNYAYFQNSLLIEKVFILLGYSLCRLGVPLFLMISGSLILNKKFDTFDDIKKFYKNNLLKLVLVVVIWNIIYYFFMIWYNSDVFSIKDLLYTILFMKKSLMPHMWYMAMIIGMYVCLPFVSAIVKKYDFKSLSIPILVAIVSFFLIPNFKTLLTFFGFKATNIKTILDLSFIGGTYGVYIIFGYFVYYKNLLKDIKTKYLTISCIFGILLCCIFQFLGYENNSDYIVYYNFIGVLISGISLFEILRRINKINNKKFSNIILLVSKFSLGIYFIHRPLLFVFKKYFILPFPTYENVLIYYIISILISFIVVILLSKIKIFKKYLFLVKN